MNPLIIGYGNPFRRDDGLGWRVIEMLEKQQIEGLRLLQTHQLMPELAEDLSQTSLVILVDASVEGQPGQVQVQRVVADQSPAPNYTHYVAPQELLVMAEVLYGCQPEAWLITVTGADFDLGDGLSPVVEGSLPGVMAEIQACLGHKNSGHPAGFSGHSSLIIKPCPA